MIGICLRYNHKAFQNIGLIIYVKFTTANPGGKLSRQQKIDLLIKIRVTPTITQLLKLEIYIIQNTGKNVVCQKRSQESIKVPLNSQI